MKTKAEERYADIVTAWVRESKAKLLLDDARNSVEDNQYTQDQFVRWAWDLYRVRRDVARRMYNKVKD